MSLLSWGRYPRVEQEAVPLFWRHEPLPEVAGTVLPRGLGRSYGDSCLNEGGTLLLCTGLDRLIDFDAETGLLTCEAGVSLETILDFAVPRGWFPPVTPGTRFVTVGGAIANDVHGKNHHVAGCFGRHVASLELLRSDGSRTTCSPEENTELFAATIGGLGLTGLITRARIRLLRIDNPFMDVEQIRFDALTELEPLMAASDRDFDYTVTWVDTAARGKRLGRGILMRGNHAGPEHNDRKRRIPSNKKLPVTLPEWVLNPLTLRAFNWGYYHKQLRRTHRAIVDHVPYFYPLDAVADWNLAYGERGFMQHQCIVGEISTIATILELVQHHGQCSFLTVLKRFGELGSPGMLSFPRPGLTLTMDFPVNRRTLTMLDEIDRVVAEAGGALYPAKDARMSPESFQRSFPDWRDFSPYIDPAFSSSFWRRVTREGEEP